MAGDRKVFISSTFEDLKDCRRAAKQAIDGQDGFYTDQMEDWGARPEPPATFCPDRVEACDVFVGILGWRYGHEVDGVSMTEREFDAATEAGLPRLMFLCDDEFPMNWKLRENDEKAEKLKRFREKVQNAGPVIDSFSICEDLRAKIAQALGNLSKETSGLDAYSSHSAHARTDTEAQTYEKAYRKAVVEKLDYLELFGAESLSQEARRHALSVGYVSLTVSSSGDGEGSVSAEGLLESLGIDEECESRGRILVRGPAGSGKSTFFRWAAIKASKKLGKVITDGIVGILPEKGKNFQHDIFMFTYWRQRIPFYIQLRNFENGSIPNPDEFHKSIMGPRRAPPPNWARALLEKGLALVLIDGVDEVASEFREKVREQIRELTSAFPDSYFLVSTRPEGVESNWLAAEGFREAAIASMSERDKNEFIDCWHAAVSAQMRVPRNLTETAEALKAQLKENPPVSRLAGTPLLAAAICALHKDRSQTLPETQAEVCEALCEMLLHRREEESLGSDTLSAFPEVYRRLTYSQKRTIISDLAHAFLVNNDSMVLLEKAEATIATSLRFLKGLEPDDAKGVLKALRERSGILRDPKPGSLDFIHNTLKEYLAAEYLIEHDRVGQLAGHFDNSNWTQVIQFAAATRQRGRASDLVNRLIDIAEDSKDPTRRRAALLLAFRCRHAALHFDEVVEERLKCLEPELIPPRNFEDAEALADGGDAIVEALKTVDSEEGETVTAARIRALTTIETRCARKALEGFFDDDRMKVLIELTRVVNPLILPAVKEHILEGGEVPFELRRAVTDLEPIADYGEVRGLNISGGYIVDISPLAGIQNLQRLDLSGTPIADIAPILELQYLQELYLNNTQVQNLEPLSGLQALQKLILYGTDVIDIGPLEGLRALRELDLDITLVDDISPLARLWALRKLSLFQTNVRNIEPLAGLQFLQELDLEGTGVIDIAPLAELKVLQELDLRKTKVTDIAPLAGLRALRTLDLSYTKVSDITPLAGIPNLVAVNLSHSAVLDLSPLETSKRLRAVNVRGCHLAAGDAVPSRPDIRVVREDEPGWVQRAYIDDDD